MGKFEQNSQKHVDQLQSTIRDLWQKYYALDWGHDCDCEFCDREQVVADETQAEADKLKADIAAAKKTIAGIADHARRHGVAVVVDVTK